VSSAGALVGGGAELALESLERELDVQRVLLSTRSWAHI
jgi:hypothetical protein